MAPLSWAPGPAHRRAAPRAAGDRRPARERGDAIQHLLEGHAGGVQQDRPGRGPQRAVLARGVALVAATLLAERGPRIGAALQRPPARALLLLRGEIDLQLGAGRDDGADVAPLGHPVPPAQQLSLLGHERLAHTLLGGHARGLARDLGRADLAADLAPVEQHAPLPQLDPRVAGQPRGVALGRGQREQRDAAVHGAAVQVGEAESPRERARDRGLAGARGPVDRDHHQPTSVARSSTKPG